MPHSPKDSCSRRRTKAQPATVALVSADADARRTPFLVRGANAKKIRIRIVHEATYPLTTEHVHACIDAARESGCDLLVSALPR